MEQLKMKGTTEFLSGGGEMGELIRNFNWTNTPLGDPGQWSESLKSVVSLMLANRFPMILWWGKEYIQFYNDAYIPITGMKHPDRVLGVPGYEGWAEIWDVIGPLVDTPFTGGPATWMDDILLKVNRNNFIEETHFIIAYSPVPDPGVPGGIGGVLATVNEITDGVISKRQMETLKELGKHISATLSESEVYVKAAQVFRSNLFDIPFALIYKIEEDGAVAKLTASSGIDIDHPSLKHTIDLVNTNPRTKDISIAIDQNKIVESAGIDGMKDLPTGEWDVMPHRIIHVPVKAANKKFPFAILTIGLNPYRKFDDAYKNFVTLISDQVSLGVNNAIAYEEERRRGAALQELDKAKTIFFSNISHEFRTPLTLMLGTIEEVLNESNIDPKDKERLNVTHRNAMRLLKLVNTLLDFSRIESGRQKADYALLDISQFTKNLAANFRSIVEKAGLKFEVKADSIVQPVYADRQMWEKIVFNLLSNAFKYTLEGQISLRLFSEKKYAVLQVEDTGVGIPEDELPHMFERFHRVRNVTGRTYEGTGIGLSLIKELVQLHGGTIQVTSREGKGSVFTVRIPFGKDHLPIDQTSESAQVLEDVIADAYIEEATSLVETNEARSSTLSAGSDRPTILVVDDNADMRDHLQSLLQSRFNVFTAANGMEALHKISNRPPTLVVTDIMMPIMDGIQLLKELKSNKNTAQIPVILLTARAGEESRIEGLETGADDYLVKPFSAKELFARIKAQVEILKKRSEVETRLREFLMQAPAAIAILEGNDYLFTLANPMFEQIFGTPGKQLTGRTVREAFPEVEGQGIFEIFQNVYVTGEPFIQHSFPATLNIKGEMKTGYYDFILQPIKAPGGETTGIMAHVVDMTESVIAHKQIEESEQRLENFIKRAPVGIVIYRGADLVVESANEEALEMWGKTLPDVKGKAIAEIFPELYTPEKVRALHEASMERFGKGQSYSVNETELRFSRNGQMYTGWYNFNYEPIPGIDGSITGMISVAVEVSDQVVARRKIEESEHLLRETKEQLELSITAGKIGVWHWDVNRNVRTWNKEQLEIFGMEPAEFKGRAEDFFDYIVEEDREKVRAASKGEFEKSGNQYEFRIRRKDGEIRWVESRSRTIMDEYGNPEFITGVNIDVTEQILARKKIEESEKELQALFMQAPVSIILFEGEEMIVKVANATALKTIGKSAEEVINRSLFSLFPELTDRVDVYNEVFRTGISYEGREVEVSFSRNNEKFTGYFDLNYSPWYDSYGKVKGVMSVGVDVTEKVMARKRIENISAELEEKVKERTAQLESKNIQLEDVQSFLQQVIDSSVEFISVLDTDLRYIIVNKRFEDGLRISRQEVEGKHLFESNPKARGTLQHESILRALKGETVHMDKRQSIARPDYYVDSYFIPLIIQHKVEGVIIMARDVTDIVASEVLLEQKNRELHHSLRELELLLGQLQDQKTRDKQKDDFILMASHELKTPVTTIKGYVQLLNQVRSAGTDLTVADNSMFDSALKTIDKQISRLAMLISELLDLSKIEKGQLELYKSVFDLSEMVRDVVKDLGYTTQHKLELTIRSNDNVYGDKERISQVLINLVTNAIKYSPGTDTIEIEVSREHNGMAAVSVKDHGIGIDQADHEKIFERFYRAQGKREKTFPGFGIGLFIANDIVRRHNGSIRVKSEKGKGSEFTFTLPVATGDESN